MLPIHQIHPFSGGNLYDKINQQKGQLFSEEVCPHTSQDEVAVIFVNCVLNFKCLLGGHMVLVPNSLSCFSHSQGWDLTQVRLCFSVHIQFLSFSSSPYRQCVFHLQRYQNVEHFPDQDGPHQAGRLRPGEEARL